ncbi:MAG TPA: FAD-binding oxidoreductase [Candidatus Stercoripulliclostridium merdipullorum]|uniref:FAD-binding oxidoreductase n=1 Tax=Candidatus Stercoripulliclostridium merdipullorum TaxID=2840952 RepID=A0A9D1NCI0_9FIRM|nr:FAD-binding oxidoreductase [Candidatus Stercoripulliclostridium merdipullorum]
MSKPYKGFRPDWQETRAPEGSYRSILKWGDPDAFKVPKESLYKMMKEFFGMTDDDFKTPREMGYEPVEFDAPIQLTDADLQAFAAIVGGDNVKTDCYSRLSVAYGKTMYDLLRLRKHIVENVPDAVLYPSDAVEIEQIVAYCDAHKIPVYVYGGGSSVTRGVECMKGGISLDMRKNFNKVIRFNEINQTITVQAGMSGPDLEKTLNNAPELFGASRRYTCGHFPQSFEYSSVGGWTVTRGAGQNSTYYGKIEHIVLGQEYVTPRGKIVTDDYAAKATGPDVNQIMMGSEGAYGILTHVTLKVFRYMPENHFKFSYMFHTWEDAQAAAREIMQAEIGYPSVFRLSDPEETDIMMRLYGIDDIPLAGNLLKLKGFEPMKRCLFLGFTDGERAFCRNIKRKVAAICRKYKAMYLTGIPVSAWEKGRFTDPYLRDSMQDFGIMTDTLECTVNWDNMAKVHETVRAYCKSRPQTICMTHMSHAYPQGANLYFIFIAKMTELDDFISYHRGILDHIQKSGAAISHHHGIGKMFAPWLEGFIGSNQLEIFKVLKQHFDPNNIMNPGGTIAVDLPEEEKRFIRPKW